MAFGVSQWNVQKEDSTSIGTVLFCITATPLSFLVPLEDQEVDKIPGEARFECEVSKPNLKAVWKFAGKVSAFPNIVVLIFNLIQIQDFGRKIETLFRAYSHSHTTRRTPGKRHQANSGTHCCLWECSHSSQAASKDLNTNGTQICARLV